MKKQIRRLLSLMLILMLVAGLIPGAMTAYAAAEKYTVTVNATPSAGGTVEIKTDVSHGTSGSFYVNNTPHIYAYPADGWHFVKWIDEDGNTLEIDGVKYEGYVWDDFVYDVKESRTFTAVFASDYCELNLSADPAAGGTVKTVNNTPSGTFNYNSVQNIYATANDGYKFVGWYENGAPATCLVNSTYTDKNAQVYLLKDTNLVAKFEKQEVKENSSVNLILPEVAGTYLETFTNQSISVPSGADDKVWRLYDLKVNGTYLSSATLAAGDVVEIWVDVDTIPNGTDDNYFSSDVSAKVNDNGATVERNNNTWIRVYYSFTVGGTTVNEYTITVEGGWASVGVGAAIDKAVAGTEITLTVDESVIPDGMVFDEWEVVSGGVTVTDGKFTMPEGAVEIKATYTGALVGDVNEDGYVTAADALEVLKTVVGKVTLTETQKEAADVTGDGEVKAEDALMILQKVVGKLSKFPVEQA